MRYTSASPTRPGHLSGSVRSAIYAGSTVGYRTQLLVTYGPSYPEQAVNETWAHNYGSTENRAAETARRTEDEYLRRIRAGDTSRHGMGRLVVRWDPLYAEKNAI